MDGALMLYEARNAKWADEMGVPLVPGSDAGSYGVEHGRGLIDELRFHHRAGVPMEHVLTSATSMPRRLWGSVPANIVAENRANRILMKDSPFQNADNLCRVSAVVFHERIDSRHKSGRRSRQSRAQPAMA